MPDTGPGRPGPDQPDADPHDPIPVARAVEVPLRRLDRWLDGFADRHGAWEAEHSEDLAGWRLAAADGSSASVQRPSWLAAGGIPGAAADDATAELAALAGLRPCFGVLLIRRAGYAVATFDGEVLRERKVSSRHIHGRTAAGGWSQQRYARRRANQADEIVGAAVAAADRIIGGRGSAGASAPMFLVTGGDRPLLADVLAQVARPVRELPMVLHLGIGTPDAEVLAGIPDRVQSVRIEIRQAPTGP